MDGGVAEARERYEGSRDDRLARYKVVARCVERVALLAFFVVLICATHFRVTHAESGQSANLSGTMATGYHFDKQTVPWRSTVAVVDTAGTQASQANLALIPGTGPTGYPALICGGNRNLPVSARMSNAAATVKVKVFYVWESGGTVYDTNISDEITLTAGGTKDSAGRYMAPTYVFSSLGAYKAYLLVTTAPSAGTATFFFGSF